MRIILDENTTDHAPTTVGDALELGINDAAKRGRIVVEILLDDAKLSDDELDAVDIARTDVESVRLVTADPTELVCDTFANMSDALRDLDAMQRSAAEMLQEDRTEEGMRTLMDALNLWMQVPIAITQSFMLLEIEPESVTVADQSLTESLEALKQQLIDVAEAVKTEDPSALADTLLYEMPEVVQQWRETFTDLIDFVRGLKKQPTTIGSASTGG